MPRAAPSFPAFDEWQKMSESEQDALLDALENGQHRNRLAAGILIGLGGVTMAAALGGLTFLLLH